MKALRPPQRRHQVPGLPIVYPPFIKTQRLWQLACPPNFQKECLRPEKIWTLPRDGRDGTPETASPIDIHGLRAGTCRWEPISDREQFLADHAHKRLCITIDAGVGKTTALRQTQYLRQLGANRDGLAMWVEFAELPESYEQYLSEGVGGFLVKKLRVSGNERLNTADPHLLRSLILRSIRRGKFTLLIDALDQSAPLSLVAPGFNAGAACQGLVDFLTIYPHVRCVVSGRPYAIQTYWESLFEHQGPWQFVKVDLFTTDEAERYVGHDKFVLLSELGADVTAIPRSLEMIRQIEGDVSGLRTKSDVYWRSLIGMLQRALHRQPADLQLTESNALYLFSLIAYEMTKREFRANVAGIRDIEKLEEVLWEIFESRKTQPSFKTRAQSFEDFKTKLSRMMAVNEFLADPVLMGSGGPSVVQLLWRNQTLMCIASVEFGRNRGMG